MNLVELNKLIRTIASKTPLVRSICSDPYQDWNTKEIEYGSVCIAFQNAQNQGNVVIYNGVLYYADRLLEDKSNILSVQNDAVSVLGAVLGKLQMEDEILDFADYQIELFEQKFADELAGGYANISITLENNAGRCGFDIDVLPKPFDDRIDVGKEGLKFSYSRYDGRWEFPSQFYDFSNVVDASYMFGDCRGMISFGVIDLSSAVNYTNMFGDINYNSGISGVIKGIGTPKECTTINLYNLQKEEWWHEWYKEDALKTLVYYSFDRAATGYPSCDLIIHSSIKAYLSETDIKTIQQKGFNLIIE